MYQLDKRIVVTLDAGGTNFVFGAYRGDGSIVDPVVLPSRATVLDECMSQIVKGFRMIIDQLAENPVAISFAFPGPADYRNGIIGGFLMNFPSFRDGVALGPFLEETFGIPAFINNDGDLYAYGEALAGVLPEVNKRLADAGSAKRFHNLLGYTFGTGFGVGMVSDGHLLQGDNSCVETFCLRHKKLPNVVVEDGVSIRAVKRVYAEVSGINDPTLEPFDIYNIGIGKREGDRQAAMRAFEELGEVAGDAMASAVTLFDALIVIGGGLTAAHELFMPALLREMRGKMSSLAGEVFDRLMMKVYNLDDEAEFEQFARGEQRIIDVYGTRKKTIYDPHKRIGVMVSRIGASRAISLGAYAYALNRIDESHRISG